MGVLNKTIIPLALVGYEMIIANSALRSYPTRPRGIIVNNDNDKNINNNNNNNTVISLACVSSETHNLQSVFLRIYDTKGGSLCEAFLAEARETGNKNRCLTKATHVLRRKLRKD